MNLLDEFDLTELKKTDVKSLRWWNIYPRSWDWSRGAKTIRYYSVAGSESADQRRVKIEWQYVMDAGNRKIITPSRTITFYDVDGSTPILMGDISKPYNPKEIGELNRDVRIGRLTDLRENAEALPTDPDNGIPSGQDIIDMIYSWYNDAIIRYEDRGSLEFEDALRNESDPTRLAVLNAPISAFGGLTIMQLLAYQMTGNYGWL